MSSSSSETENASDEEQIYFSSITKKKAEIKKEGRLCLPSSHLNKSPKIQPITIDAVEKLQKGLDAISIENPSFSSIKTSDTGSSSSTFSFADTSLETLKSSAKSKKLPDLSLSNDDINFIYDDILRTSRTTNLYPAELLKPTTNLRRLEIELEEITNEPPPNIIAYLKSGDNLQKWEASIQGPPDSPYEGGTFCLDISFPSGYPLVPPKITFTTPIYHCNISSEGSIGLDILGTNWSPALNISKMLLSIQSLLTECNPDESHVPEIADQYINNREEHDRICREWTKIFSLDYSEM